MRGELLRKAASLARVVMALNSRDNALLESPTGTGKTLSLLCATLGWRASYKARKQKCVRPCLDLACGRCPPQQVP